MPESQPPAHRTTSNAWPELPTYIDVANDNIRCTVRGSYKVAIKFVLTVFVHNICKIKNYNIAWNKWTIPEYSSAFAFEHQTTCVPEQQNLYQIEYESNGGSGFIGNIPGVRQQLGIALVYLPAT